jgi:hypothetical protein
MTTLDHLIKVCKAIPGFCERSRSLSDLAGKAIVEGIILSGQTVPVAGQRYISYPGTSPMSSNNRIGSTTPGIFDRQTWTLPPLQELTVQCTDARPTPVRFPMGLTQRQDTTTQTPPATGLRYIDYPGTAAVSSNGQVGSAIADRQTLNSLPSIHEINEQPTRPNTMPSFRSCNVHGEAEINPGPNTDSTWPATELETLPTLNIGDWGTLCGEVELSAMPDMDHLWPFEERRAVSMSNDDWSTLCGEVEISTMQNEPVAWPGSLGVEGFAALTSDGNRPNGGEVTSGRSVS